jgi:hypothetical protein
MYLKLLIVKSINMMEDYIYEYQTSMDENLCKSIIERFENDSRKQEGETAGGINKNIKVSTDLPIGTLLDDWIDVNKIVCEEVKNGLIAYKKHVKDNDLEKNYAIGSTIDSSTIGFPQIQKTEVGGFYRWHHDTFHNRIFTYILYLNDVEEGVGGTTDFLCGKKVLPKRGKIVIFPSATPYVHRGKQLTKGVKYIVTNFVYNGAPINEHKSP